MPCRQRRTRLWVEQQRQNPLRDAAHQTTSSNANENALEGVDNKPGPRFFWLESDLHLFCTPIIIGALLMMGLMPVVLAIFMRP